MRIWLRLKGSKKAQICCVCVWMWQRYWKTLYGKVKVRPQPAYTQTLPCTHKILQ